MSVGKDVEKGNTCALLVGMWIGATTMGNSMEIPQKIKNKTTLWSSNSTLEYLSKEMKTVTPSDIWTPMFTAALLTMTKIWKQLRCPPMDEWIKKCGIYTQWNIIKP